ncbi:MAG: serine/threonine protein kinase [Actinobacteria bacterium]|nr:serine/threonine protein kinase [Actinomycetota bacterium]
MIHSLLAVANVDGIESHLRKIGQLFRVFDRQDSECVSYGVAVGAKRWFVKTATTPLAVESLRRAVTFHAAVTHPALVPLTYARELIGGAALVYPWVDAEVLYHATIPPSVNRSDPDSAMARFRRRPVTDVRRAIDTVLDAHCAVERSGFVAVDFYDGAMLYDFTEGEMKLCDLDEYRPGPFAVDADRMPGSGRYMAPEEFQSGATIDFRTTVYNLGRAARLLLDSGDNERAWRGTGAQLAVVRRATAREPGARYRCVQEFTAAWRAASTVSTDPKSCEHHSR